LFTDPNHSAAFVPEFESSLAGSGELPGFLLVSLKMADKKGGKNRKIWIFLFGPKLADTKSYFFSILEYAVVIFSVRYLVLLRPRYCIIYVSTDWNVAVLKK
jgi:hypothetical protein